MLLTNGCFCLALKCNTMRYIKNTLLIVSAALFACNPEKQVGPDIEGIGFAPSPTSSFKASSKEVNFKSGETIYFTQEFEKSTHWKITLTGQNSGASKTFENVSSSVNKSNTNWDGLTEVGVGFQIENVVAILSYPDFPSVLVSKDTFKITGIEGSVIKAVKYSDFIKAPIYTFGGAVPAGGGWGSDWPTTNNTNTAFPKYDGNAYMYIAGAPWQANNPYVDITEMPANLGDTISSKYLPLYNNPERVYINLAVYNTGTTDTWLQVQMLEDNGAGVARSWNIRPDWVGWKNISIKYSNLASTNTSAFNPSIVKQINLVLLSDQEVTDAVKKEVSVAIDQLVFSFDAPLGTVVK
jgi:hypothetical protein